jgi:hypothetical protein
VISFPFTMDYPVYLPSFLNDNNHDSSGLKDDDWLTNELKDEIAGHFPDKEDIGDDRARCKLSFEKHAELMFPKDRVFASFVQLRVAVDFFLQAWGGSCSHGSSRLTCFYGKPSRKPRISVVEPDKQRVRATSLKEQLCPFKILYSLQGKAKQKASKPKDNVFYQVKITNVDYEHTCELSPKSCRLALKGSGKLVPNLVGLQDVLSILREHPTLDHKVLRSLLHKYVPFYQSLDGAYIRNFRLRALNYVDNSHELTMLEARALTSKSRSSADECVSSDNPIFTKNFKSLLQKSMQEVGDTWEALKYLRTLEKNVPGFEFRIQYDESGRPTAICWMLPHMRVNLLRYGDVLFLDTMMKDYNVFGWPYMGPTVKDGEMKIRQVAECIAIEETLENYQFVIQTMASIEKRWFLSELRIIFGDQFITNTLLENLGITFTCTLRCDYHHVVKEVWPKQFGLARFKQLKPYLTRMLKSKSQDEYRLSYELAMEIIQDDPLKASYVEMIYKNPEYYSGHTLRQIDGNLLMMGDAPAEQNHSSVAAHLGQGANWLVSEHVRQLIERQNTLEKTIHYQDNKLYTSSLSFRSQLVGSGKKDEEQAKKHLTIFAFNKLFIRSREYSKELKKEPQKNGTVLVWPHFEERGTEKTVTLYPNQRCGCRLRRAFKFQCSHEYALDGRFDLEKYHSRWLMTKKFRLKFPLLCSMPSLPGSTDAVAPFQNHSDIDTSVPDTGRLSPTSDIEDNEHRTGILDLEHESQLQNDDDRSFRKNMNYVFAMGRCGQLCKTAGHDKVALASVVSLVDEATERLRKGLHISPIYTDFSSVGGLEEPTNRPPAPLPAVPGTNRSPTSQSRFKSGVEWGSRKRSRGIPLSTGRHVDHSQSTMQPLTNTAKRTKTCSMCYQQGHTIRNCPSLDPYDGIPLPKDDRDSRSELSVSLSQPNTYTSLPLNPGTIVHQSLPTGVQALIIHHRTLVDSTLLNSLVPSNFGFECTILHAGGIEHERYTRKTFQLGCIAKHITNNKQNIVISELKLLPAVAAMPYLSQQSMSFLTQPPLSQNIDDGDGPVPMGYGYC